ncbi:MAG TPA: cytochrome c [Acidimicrobiales bacterium]|nr:cytochrome c [Acidimicrobiales bacterium]
MTEVPEHLLQRSRERRAALGLGGDAPAEGSSAVPATTGAAPASGATADAAEAPVAAAVAPEPVVVVPPRPRPPRTRVPAWVLPVLVVLPVWAFFYMGAFGEREAAATGPNGAQLFATNCASCHGATGGGGAGPALAKGEAKLTFPSEADHVKWVHGGSESVGVGNPYGDPARGRVAKGGMPAFEGALTDAQIAAIVKYEREGL